MIEAGVVIGKNYEPLFWHLPKGRTGGSIPDTRSLWDVLWDNRDIVLGFAHSHPGAGIPGPSQTDITTFIAVEAALGRRLHWWITSADSLLVCNWTPDELPPWGKVSHTSPRGVKDIYQTVVLCENPDWADELRRHSAS